MIINILILIIIIILAIFLILHLNIKNITNIENIANITNIENKLNSKCWIDNNLFPEAKIFFDNRAIILDDLNNILTNNKWSIWSNDYNTTPIFTKMTNSEIINRMDNNIGKINSNPSKPSWRLFGLILNKEILDNGLLCKNTINLLLNNSTRILNAGFSLLEPGAYIGLHKDFNNKFYRLHIPLQIPINNNNNKNSLLSIKEINNKINNKLSVLQVESDYRIWKQNEYFIFDDTCEHNAWNYTNENRIILIIDLLK